MTANPHRYRLRRAGVLNVWQYDEQVFDIDGGRMLLRGTNGAGKSKTLEMLLPFVLDGDKARITASGRHHTSLLWLMLDGYDGASRTGYLWVEFERTDDEGERHTITCGVGVRASQSARSATAWFFTTTLGVGRDLHLEDANGPVSRDRLTAMLADDGRVFDSAPRYREHVGRTLFGLGGGRYDELLRLLYWLRQPQVGEDIEPARLAGQLVQALPQVDDVAVRAAGDTFDELEAFGEQIERMAASASAVVAFVEVYTAYTVGVVRQRASGLVGAHRDARRRASAAEAATSALEDARATAAATAERLEAVERALEVADRRRTELETSPEARTQQRILELAGHVDELGQAAERAGRAEVASRERSAGSRNRVETDGDALAGALRRESADVARTSALMRRCGWERGLGVDELWPAHGPGLREEGRADGVRRAVTALAADAGAQQPVAGERLAAVQVVAQAQQRHADAVRAAHEQQARHADAEQRADAATERAGAARATAQGAEEALVSALHGWARHSPGVVVPLPELDEDALAALAATAHEAAAPARDALVERRARAADRRHRGRAELDELAQRRGRVLAERDPRPAAPAWARDDRDGLAGAPLWRLVDFRDEVPAARAAGVEAALEASGLLDAWVSPDGRVRDADRADVVLPVGGPVAGATLGEVLVPDVDLHGVAPQVVEQVIARIGWGGPGTSAVDGEGRWWLGALAGRGRKPVAQYVGAGARRSERERRLAEIDTQVARVQAEVAAAEAEQAAAAAELTRLEAWLAALPAAEPLLRAWAELRGRQEAAQEASAAAREAGERAEASRRAAATALAELGQLALRHDLPREPGALAERRELLVGARAALGEHVRRTDQLVAALDRWLVEVERWSTDEAEAGHRMAEAAHARGRHEEQQGRLDEMRSALGAGVDELERRLARVRQEITVGRRTRVKLRGRSDDELGARGRAEQALAEARQRQEESRRPLADAMAALAVLADVPGLLRLAVPDLLQGGAETLASASRSDGEVPRAVAGLARELAGLPEPARQVDVATVLQAWQQLSSGPAADTEPRVVEQHGVQLVLARDDAGEHPVGDLAERLVRAVEENRELLTERERRLFEDHVLGHLGESLRARRIEADELVTAMNGLLEGVTTSQGIRVRLQWKLRDDIPAEARRAVELLGQPTGALLPDERRELRDALHDLIKASRSEAPGDSYAEHLARALDYRQWFAFTIRYRRPEASVGGAQGWADLHRKSALSQGEQKVVCYLPLFAAAAAHYTSLAGAAPDAPRLVLLDDAFPKIDARTHPLLFGLLVDLDLDFVVTSERLWGDHATVPSLAIYEALRDPLQRGIAQFHHRWDGQRLHAVGA